MHSDALNRSSRPEVFIGKGVLKYAANLHEHPCWSVISIKLLWNFIEIALRHACSPVSLLHIFRIPFYKNTSGRLPLTKYFENSLETIVVHSAYYLLLFLLNHLSVLILLARNNKKTFDRKILPNVSKGSVHSNQYQQKYINTPLYLY